MAISEGTILRVVATMLFPDSVVAQNVFHIVLTALVGDGDEDDVVTDARGYISDIYAEIVAEMSDLIDSTEVAVYEFDPVDEDFDEVGTQGWNQNFTGALEMLPHGVAAVNIFKTQDPDVDGRKFWGGFTEGRQADGSWLSASLTAQAAASGEVVTQFVGNETGSTYTPGVWSPTNTFFYLYSGTVLVNAVCGYQRRRKPGVGI